VIERDDADLSPWEAEKPERRQNPGVFRGGSSSGFGNANRSKKKHAQHVSRGWGGTNRGEKNIEPGQT